MLPLRTHLGFQAVFGVTQHLKRMARIRQDCINILSLSIDSWRFYSAPLFLQRKEKIMGKHEHRAHTLDVVVYCNESADSPIHSRCNVLLSGSS